MGGKSRSSEQTQDHAQERKKHQGLTQQCMWHSDSDGDKRRKFRKYPLSNTPQTRVLSLRQNYYRQSCYF